ncbi:hypothetical protein CBS147333_10342 [Penicillium roqueforti]|nr:hypothetical protein CBS147333_10342 [Penicillium roqueforti]
MEKNPAIKLYVREIVYNEKGAFIFCALNEQLEILASLHSFEVDMSYKRVKGVFNEVIFATFVPKHGKIMTLFRVFTDQETTKAYHFIFGNVFNLVERCIGKKIKFHYLHGSGIRSIITDMCPKQMTGLGKMLQETDQKTNNRDLGWRWHTMNELADLIIAHNPELKGWAEHKKIDVIAAGLCNACSPIDSMFFEIRSLVQSRSQRSSTKPTYSNTIAVKLSISDIPIIQMICRHGLVRVYSERNLCAGNVTKS